MSGHKKQHYVPRCYLKAWCDPSCPPNRTPFVWLFDREGAECKPKSPGNLFHENNLYTIEKPDGGRNLVLEHGLQQLEDEFARLRNRKLNFRRELDGDEKLLLCAFTAAMQSRTKAQRDHWAHQWKRPLEMADAMQRKLDEASKEERKRIANASPPQSSRGSSISHEELRALAARPLQNMMAPIINTVTPLLFRMDLALFFVSTEPGFITSDHPCVWFDPESYKRPPLLQGAGLGSRTVEVSLPLSPGFLAYLNWQGVNGYIEANEKVVNEFNRRTRFYADEHFVVSKPVKNDYWFQRGVEPEDSWEKNEERKR